MHCPKDSLYLHIKTKPVSVTRVGVDHREITVIELQSLVVFGCTALLFMVGATASTHDREEGWDDFLFVYTE